MRQNSGTASQQTGTQTAGRPRRPGKSRPPIMHGKTRAPPPSLDELQREAEAAAREAKRAARKAAAQSKAAEEGEDPIQAAIERAKAKKAEQESAS